MGEPATPCLCGFRLARLYPPPEKSFVESERDEVRFAFDGDAVLFDTESDQIYAERISGLSPARTSKCRHSDEQGPFGQFLIKLAHVRRLYVRSDREATQKIELHTASQGGGGKELPVI